MTEISKYTIYRAGMGLAVLLCAIAGIAAFFITQSIILSLLAMDRSVFNGVTFFILFICVLFLVGFLAPPSKLAMIFRPRKPDRQKPSAVYTGVIDWNPGLRVSLRVSVNSASRQDLETVPGIGPALAQRIIDGRPYESVYDLISVNGVGSALIEELNTYMTVE